MHYGISLLLLFTIGLIGFTGIAFATHGNDGDHVGTLQWLKASYPASGTAVVRVIDPDMNLNPKKIDNFDVFVRSDSHTKGLYLTATETGVSTGVFDGTLFLSLEHLGTGHRLKVAEGDTITATYEDGTLPASYTANVLNVIAKSEIRPTLESPLKQYEMGIPIDGIECKDGLVQVFKKSDNFPACVKPLTAEKLVQRGWATNDDSESLNKRWGELYLEYQSLKKSFSHNPDNMTIIERMTDIDDETMRIATILSEREFTIDVPETKPEPEPNPIPEGTYTDKNIYVYSVDEAIPMLNFKLSTPYLPEGTELDKIKISSDKRKATIYYSNGLEVRHNPMGINFNNTHYKLNPEREEGKVFFDFDGTFAEGYEIDESNRPYYSVITIHRDDRIYVKAMMETGLDELLKMIEPMDLNVPHVPYTPTPDYVMGAPEPIPEPESEPEPENEN